jgi:hypothetical protein
MKKCNFFFFVFLVTWRCGCISSFCFDNTKFILTALALVALGKCLIDVEIDGSAWCFFCVILYLKYSLALVSVVVFALLFFFCYLACLKISTQGMLKEAKAEGAAWKNIFNMDCP